MRGRHLLVAFSVLVAAAVTAFGLIGPSTGPERITSYDVLATVNPDRTVSVREVIDWDFGVALTKHGIFRDIPTDAGVPEQVRVWSPGAPDDAQVSRKGNDLSIRIGDPNAYVRGRQRYVITYLLPSLVTDDRLAFDAIGTAWPVPIEEARVEVRGAELSDTECFQGSIGSDDPCPVEAVDGGYLTEVTDLDANEAVTVEGTVVSPPASEDAPAADEVATAAAGQPLPPFTPRDPALAARWAAIVAAVGAAVGMATYGWSRRTGRNEVAVGGATEAAFADMSATGGPVPGSTRLVADENMGELAGLDFTPPPDVEPWQGAVVLRETISKDTIGAWFSSQAARDVVTFSTHGGTVRMSPGPKAAEADAETATILNKAMAHRSSISLGSYDPAFSSAWDHARSLISTWARTSGTFRHRPPTGLGGGGGHGLGVGLVVLSVIGVPIMLGLHFTVGLQTATTALVVAVVLPGVMGLSAYRRLVRSLTAKGSAIHLRTESFRRFLHDSEAQHVEWAWRNGLLRDYSAWAVALGEARAWDKALSASAVPPSEVDVSHGVLAPSLSSGSFSSATTAPSSSSGGSGGGGGAGGGGGGGGGGSW